MPEIKATVETEVEVSFEAFCEKCGAGICNNVSTRNSYRRGQPQIVITPCQLCLDNSYEEGQNSRDDEITELSDQIGELSEQLENYHGNT